MTTAGGFPEFAQEHRFSLALSVFLHVALLLTFSSSLILVPTLPQQLAIEAVVIDESKLNKAAEQERKKADEQQRKREAEAERQRQEQQRQREEQQRQQAEQQRQREAAAEQQRQEQQRVKQEQDAQRKREAEQQRVAEEKRVAEQRAAEERARREAEARAEAERQRMIEAAEREEQSRREAELAAAIAAEEEVFAARQSGEMSRYLGLIQQKVERNWSRPASAGAGLKCEVAVVQLPNGDVVDVSIRSCNGDDVVRRSIESAVRRASPLPLPENRLLFDRNITFIFEPLS